MTDDEGPKPGSAAPAPGPVREVAVERAGVSRPAFRPEIEGLRALSVALVIVYHVWFNQVSGGVDVFFVISGFLLTAQLTRAAQRGPIQVGPRLSRILVRLLPTASVVLFVTVLGAAALLPEGRWPQTVREVLASAVMLQNWQLAADAVDYAARNNVASVVQHFWSLSVQVQFFLMWPPLVALVVMGTRRAADLRGRLTLLALLVFVVSFVQSVWLTVEDQPLAYFHTLCRLWEFALGALLALGIDRIVLSRAVRVVIGWVGVAGLLVCGVLFDVRAFPGFAGLWPTGCAVLVLLAGTTGAAGGADRLLAARPAQWLGALSFPLYLWHWPVLVLYLVAWDRDQLGVVEGLGVVAVSLVLAVVTRHLVELPMERARGEARSGVRVCAAGMIMVLLAAGVWQAEAARRATRPVLAEDAHPGARALLGAAVPEAPLLPPPVSVYDDWVAPNTWDCAPMDVGDAQICTTPSGPEPPARRLLLVGDSHVQQLAGALLPVAQRHGWQLVAMIHGACPFSMVSEVAPDDEGCAAWLEAAAAKIPELGPDVVVTLASRDVRAGLTEQTPPGFVERWAQLGELGIPVLAVRDNPRFDFWMPDCVQREGRGAAACGVARGAVYGQPPWAGLDDVPANVTFLDIADAVCEPAFCPAEIGNVLVYLDDNHISATYAASMADLIEPQVVAAVDR